MQTLNTLSFVENLKTTVEQADPITLAKCFMLVAEEVISSGLLSASYHNQLRSMKTNLQRNAFTQALGEKE